MIKNITKDGRILDYYEWSREYRNTADSIARVIDKLKACRNLPGDRHELDLKIAKYKVYYNECMRISNLLMERFRGVG